MVLAKAIWMPYREQHLSCDIQLGANRRINRLVERSTCWLDLEVSNPWLRNSRWNLCKVARIIRHRSTLTLRSVLRKNHVSVCCDFIKTSLKRSLPFGAERTRLYRGWFGEIIKSILRHFKVVNTRFGIPSQAGRSVGDNQIACVEQPSQQSSARNETRQASVLKTWLSFHCAGYKKYCLPAALKPDLPR